MDGSELATWGNDPLWYQDAIIYELHVKAFFDSTNDGIGDFRGLTQKLDYIHDLGVNTIWLLPFYPSPLKDDGYDIADYHGIHPDYGTRKDFRAFVREAHRRGLKIITELVINHTSDQHPWFQAARRAPPGSAKRDYYVWSETAKKFPETRLIFSDTESSNWTWDPLAKAYYWHRFFSHQPDLNHNNPHVVKAMLRVMRYWLDLGVDGLRLDAIPYLCVRDGTHNENLPETHAVIKYMRAELDRHYSNRMFLAEANQWPEDVREYFGDGDECHMAYHFPLMPRMYVAIAQEDRHPIIEIMQQTPDIPPTCQWAIFLRNHDELTLEMVTDRERDYMYEMYAADPRMRLNLGIRRRLAPLMQNEADRIKLMHILLLSLPGSPILYYGDEIGMGDNIYLGDRNGVRTPMQWSPDRNAGFSRVDPERLYLPPIMDAVYGYPAINVEAQSRNPSSPLSWLKRLIAVRNCHKAFGRGTLTFLYPRNRRVLAFLREYHDEVILCIANLSRSAQPVELDLASHKGRTPLELLGRTAFPPLGDLPYLLTLPGYGFYWFRLGLDIELPPRHEERVPLAELPVLVMLDGWQTFSATAADPRDVRRLMAMRATAQLLRDVLPAYIASQRWFAAKGTAIERVSVLEQGEWKTDLGSWLLMVLEVHGTGGVTTGYFLPLAVAWDERGAEEHLSALRPWAVARVRRQARMGILFDAFGDQAFIKALVAAMAKPHELPFGSGWLQFVPTSAYTGLAGQALGAHVQLPRVEQSNSSAVLGGKLFVKGYRRLHAGINVELEMGRFLTEVSPFPHIAPLAGAIEHRHAEGHIRSLALVQAYVENEGDAWSYTLAYLERFLGGCFGDHHESCGPGEGSHPAYLTLIRTLGRCTAGLHQALGRVTGDPAFDPEPVRPEDVAAWLSRVQQDVHVTLDRLERQTPVLPTTLQAAAERLVGLREMLLSRVSALSFDRLEAAKTRYHGDLHLGQVLLAGDEVVFVDFEGEAARPLAERRSKHSPLRDVAGMLRSFDYAAAAALNRCTQERPSEADTLRAFAEGWRREVSEAFLESYRAEALGCASFPQDPTHARDLIQLFTFEKAFYELHYEMDHRPDWIALPLEGLLEMLAHQLVDKHSL